MQQMQQSGFEQLRPQGWGSVTVAMNSQTLDEPASDINSAPPWPRRTPKACASCRRDKIRCDGTRPCSNCTKKGYPPEQCVDGCENCRRARVRCEEGKPCYRCRQLQLDCVEDLQQIGFTGQDAILSSSSTRAPPPQRPNGSDRAKLACQNCRRDNKKCDDQRPCSRCIARSEECVHVARGPKLVKLRCEGCRQDNKRCEDARPCTHCLELGRECVSVPRKGRGHGTRVKAACMSCRRDKIRCDGSRPCRSCARKGYDCVDRPCRDCVRCGKGDQCTHRRSQDNSVSDTGDETTDASQLVSDASPSISPIDTHQPNPFTHTTHLHMPAQQLSYYPAMSSMQPFYYPPQPALSPVMDMYATHDPHAAHLHYPVVHHSQASGSMMPPPDNGLIAALL
ncbi:hypothetical protein BDN71DRAFT_1445142 [Pleurotus eryngii]|uniref:Transcription activator of gluconeogenesis ERT1 n=1 Tax=Pleurotus eryngii TaxID=5323 RepID=A0A9P6DGT5_PLEER|nr:hypothetical protein BDN71DRAFT_1445142 [Pleurotus eryngii]